MMKKYLLVLAFVLLTVAKLDAQVTIGSSDTPKDGSLLDLKEFVPQTTGGPNSSKGLLLSRVALSKRIELLPMFDPSLIGTPDYENVQKISHTGVVVFNTSKVPSELLNIGLYVWNGINWVAIGHNDTTSDYTVISSNIFGNYKANTAVTNSHYIDVTIQADNGAIGRFYDIKTISPVNGITFSARGEITSANQVIRLQAVGTPLKAGAYKVTLVTNNLVQTTFSVTMNVAYPLMKIAGFGSAPYSIASGSTSGSYRVLTGGAAFGSLETSTVKTEGFTFIHNVALTATTLNNVLAQKPDIIAIAYPNTISVALVGTLKTYVSQGGVLLAYIEDNASAQTLARAIYDDQSITASAGGGRGTIYHFTGPANDPIMKGPFADLTGKSWGEDASTTQVVNNLPQASTIVYSTHTNGTGATMFRHTTLNFMFIGDGGFNSYYNDGGGLSDYGAYPFRIEINGYPATKLYGEPVGVRTTTYNSHTFANILAWAIDRAYTTGINKDQWQ